MSTEDANDEPRVHDEEILAVFARREDSGLQALEVADELPLERDVLEDRLDDLYERGLLDTEDVSRGTLWRLAPEGEEHLPPDGEVETDVEAQAAATTGPETTARQQETPSANPQPPTEEPLGDADEPDVDAIAAFDPPGTSEQQDRRRGVVRAAYSYLRKRGSAEREDFEADVYPERPGGYESASGEWWTAVVRPGLDALPDVEAEDGEWRFVGDPEGRA